MTLTRVILVLLILTSIAVAAGEVDPTFQGSAHGDPQVQGTIGVIEFQPDGKILIGGFFTEANGHAGSGIARLNPDGSPDKTFTSPDFWSGFGLGSTVTAIAVQPDGKIIVGGGFAGVGAARFSIARLNPNGSLDPTFVAAETTPGSSSISAIKIQPDGKIVVSGSIRLAGETSNRNMIRLNPNGSLDNSFASVTVQSVADFVFTPAGKIIIVGGAGGSQPGINRLNADGTVDPTFIVTVSGTGALGVVKLLSDGKFYVAGNQTVINGVPQGRISRINADGSLDTTFNAAPGPNLGIADIAVQPDGKVIAVGGFATVNSIPRQQAARFNTNGTLDETFVNNGVLTNSTSVGLLPDGRVLVGSGTFFESVKDPLVRLNADGTHDSSFVGRVTRNAHVNKVVWQADGKVLAGGRFVYANDSIRRGLVRYNPDGTLDSSFVPYFNSVTPPPTVTAIAVQPDGKVLVGFEGGLSLKRLNADGSEDMSFNAPDFPGATVREIVVMPDGQILTGGTSKLRRLNTNGSLDASFPVHQVDNEVFRILVRPDSKILVAGAFTEVGPSLRSRIARLNADGSLDNTFDPGTGANNIIEDIDVQPDGKIVVGGRFTILGGNLNLRRIGRLNADGSLDSSFVQNTNADVAAVKVQPDGKILIGGSFSAVVGGGRNGIARFNPDGSLDATFTCFANRPVFDIQLQPDGKLLVGGAFSKINDASAVRVGRLLNNLAPASTGFDYDGDDKADVSVFRPSENKWYIFRSSDSVITQQIFAIAGDVPAPADYDGDQKTDMAIYRPSQGGWWYLSTVDGQPKFAQLGGEAGDVPRPSDFDGDGRADFIIFRPSNSTWYRISSGNGATSTIQFGLAGDKPVTGDFDGDGKSDVAIYRPSSGDWWYQSSINNAQLATHFGISTDIPTPADFDGDGRTDFAVYRPSTGVWYILNSSNGSATIMAFGISEDKPVAADYDGDGKADIAVFRPSTGVWYLMRSTAGFTAMQFGISSDIPTENSFVP